MTIDYLLLKYNCKDKLELFTQLALSNWFENRGNTNCMIREFNKVGQQPFNLFREFQYWYFINACEPFWVLDGMNRLNTQIEFDELKELL